MSPEQQRQEDFHRDEYKLVYDAYKFFVSIRFIAAAFGISIQSALFTIFNQVVRGKSEQGFAMFCVAILFLFAQLVIELRTTELFRDLLKRGADIEIRLGMPNSFLLRINRLSSQKGWRRFLTHRWGIRFVYVGVFSLWVFLLLTSIFYGNPTGIMKGTVHV